MKNRIIIIFLILVLQNCNVQSFDTWKNDNIDPNIKEQIKQLNDKLFQGLRNKDISAIKSIMSDQLLGKGIGDDDFINKMISAFNPDKYKILDEYYIRNSAPENSNTISSGQSGENDYKIHFIALNKEMYISLLIPSGTKHDFLVLAIYGKYNDEWKINILQFGQLRLYGQNTPDYYRLALASERKSELFDAFFYLSIAKLISHPANSFFIYNKEKEISDLEFRIRKELNLQFQLPLTIEKIQSHPIIIGFSTEVLDEGFYPLIKYVTTLNIDDTLALKIENTALKAIVKQLFPGVYHRKTKVYYKAYNEIPNGTKMVKYYRFVDFGIDQKKLKLVRYCRNMYLAV